MENRYPPLRCRLLRAHRERPCSRAAKQRDELAPFHELLPLAEDDADHGILRLLRQCQIFPRMMRARPSVASSRIRSGGETSTYSIFSAAIFSSRRGMSTGFVSKSSQPAAIALSRSALIASPILRGSTLIAMMQAAH